jgi:hypothetical protein
MTSLKDNLLLEKESLELSLAEGSFSFRNFLRGFPPGKKMLLLVLAIALVPAIVGVRLGTQVLTEKRLAQSVITAHPSFLSPKAPVIGAVQLFNSNHGWYSAIAEVSNENLDLGATNVAYHFNFYDSSGELVTTTSGTLYLLPDQVQPSQKKYIVAPRVDSKQALSRGELVLGEVKWQKRLTVPNVELKAAAPFLSNETDPLTLVAEGAVVNNSPYELAALRLVFLLYDQTNKLVGVSQREEFSLPAFGRRAYKQTWPDLAASNISKVVVLPETNMLDINNLISR